MSTVEQMKHDLAALGYVVLKEKSYRAAQQRQSAARWEAHIERENAESARRWARDCLTEERRLRDRLTHIYAVAKAHGATTEELHGCEQCKSYVDTIAELVTPSRADRQPHPDVMASSAQQGTSDLAASTPDPAVDVAGTTP